jgi:rare lipoprotein A
MFQVSGDGCQDRRKSAVFSPLTLLMLLLLAACAGQGTHWGTSRSTSDDQLVVLPKGSRYTKLNPYIVNGERYYPIPDAQGFVQHGKASWYGKDFHGRRTASGERFNMYEKTAAHKTLPMNTYVSVLNVSNNKQTVVRINDRGPFVKGRVIDLTYAAAKDIGLIGPGVARVKLVALGKEIAKLQSQMGYKPVVETKKFDEGQFTVQVGAFRERENALKLADRLKVIFAYVDVLVSEDGGKGSIYRVRVSKTSSMGRASEMERRLEGMGFEEAFIVRL